MDPEKKTVTAGGDTEFTVKATGDGLKFQWQKDCQDINVCDGRYRDTHSDCLRIIDLDKSDSGRFRCHVENYIGDKYSDEALLTVSKFFICSYNMILLIVHILHAQFLYTLICTVDRRVYLQYWVMKLLTGSITNYVMSLK